VLPNPAHSVTDPAVVRELVRANPWATLVSEGEEGIVASHYPVLLDEEGEDLTLLTHLGRPDDVIHELGSGEIMVIVQGNHGYISPSWYAPGATRAPTWNFTVAHLYGVPEVLSEEQNVDVLTRLVAHFERHVEEPLYLEPETAEKLSPGTVGIRLPITRFTCKVKMSADKDPVSQRNVLAQLRGTGPYASPALAADMERALAQAK
jgi:transcriptional regulator